MVKFTPLSDRIFTSRWIAPSTCADVAGLRTERRATHLSPRKVDGGRSKAGKIPRDMMV
jgi:hypothetical protein